MTTDASGNGNDGTLLGGSYTNGVSGATNGAVHFGGDPSQAVVVADSPALRPGTMTVSTWLRATKGATAQIAIKSHYPNTAAQMWSFYLDEDIFSPGSPVLVFAIKRNSGGTPAGWYYGYSQPLTLTNQWTMVTAEYDGSKISLFVDGAPMPTMQYPATIPPGPIDSIAGGEINIGRSAVVQYPFVGDISQFRLYGRALSPTDVQALYQAAASGQPAGRTATGTATIDNGFVVAVRVADGGAGYLFPPNVTLTGGGGAGAVAKAFVTNGAVYAFQVVNPGGGYTSAPVVVVDAPRGATARPYRPALASAQVVNGFVVGFQITDPGAGYTNVPALTVLGGGGLGATGTVQLSNGSVSGAKVITPGAGYTNAPSVQIAAPGPLAATATARLNGGFVVDVSVNYQGGGYSAPPAVQFIGGGGSGATATAVIANGVVIGVQMTATGSGYTNPPIVRIDPPSSVSIPPSGVRLSVKTVHVTENVTPGRIYALETSEDLRAWSQIGDPFTASASSTVVDVDVGGSQQYFRLRDLTYSP